MNSKKLYQPIKLSQSMLINIRYPLEIWWVVFNHLDIGTYKAFFETCWAFKSFCTREVINRVVHKADSLYTMFGRKTVPDLEMHISLSLLLRELKKGEHSGGLPLGIYSRKDVPFAFIKRLCKGDLANIKGLIERLECVVRNFIITKDEWYKDVMPLIANDTEMVEDMAYGLSLNPNMTWECLESLISLEVFDGDEIASRSYIPFDILMGHAGLYWTNDSMTPNPNITIEYMLDNPNCDWRWSCIVSKSGWTQELIERFLTLDITLPSSRNKYEPVQKRLRAIYKGEYELTSPGNEYPFLGSNLPNLNKELFKYIPKGFMREYIEQRYYMSTLKRCYFPASFDNGSEVLKGKHFEEDELRDLLSTLLNLPVVNMDYLWSLISLNPSLTLSIIKGFGDQLLSKVNVASLLINESFGFLDILEVIEYQALMAK